MAKSNPPSRQASHKLSPRPSQARQRIAAACRQIVAGKQAARDLTQWIVGCDLSEVEFRLLWMLFDAAGDDADGELEQGALIVLLAASPALVSGAVERLRSLGLLECRPNPADRRRQQWRLTAAGADQVRSVVAAVEAFSAHDSTEREATGRAAA